MKIFQNYHRHSFYTNIRVPDSATYNEDYAKRAVELGHGIISSVEHGTQGRYIEAYEYAKKYNLKFLFGTEAYWVKDRKENDRTNAHICLLAATENGRQSINEILSEANISGYYYQPRIDLDLIFSLPKEDVWVTSACFEKNTKVLTKNETKNIQDVKSGDLVLTHKGTWEKVIVPTMRKYKGEMYNLFIEGCFESIKCTKDHKFPTINKTHSDVTKQIIWKRADELTLDDRILSAIDNTIENIDYINIDSILNNYREDCNLGRPLKSPITTSKIKVDALFLQILGLYAAEGNINDEHNYICFTLNKKEINLFNLINEFSLKYLNKQAVIQDKKNTNGMSVLIHSKEMALLFSYLVPSGVANKKSPNFILRLPPRLQMEYIKGLFLGDGHISKNSNRINYVTVSEQLGYEVGYILERNGLKSCCSVRQEKTDKNNVHHRKCYVVEINSKEFHEYWKLYTGSNNKYDFVPYGWNSKKPVIIDGVSYLHRKTRRIEKYSYDDNVYCLSVENTPSFRVEGISVHNCLAFWKYGKDTEEIVKSLKNHFGKNFYLEVQNHNTPEQSQLNKEILDFSKVYNIPIIMGCDSHYITPEKAWERDEYVRSKGINYDDEQGWFMDYPDGETAYNRFISQGILTKYQIEEAMDNTNIFLNVAKYDNPIFNKEIKMPTLYPNLTQDEKNTKYENLVWQKWNIEKAKILPELHSLYESEIVKEIDTVKITNHADYFLLDYEIIKRALEKGGLITETGRGSGVSFYTNKLLGFTKVDRIAASVKMYPERFMSATRILESKSLADLDLNLANPSVFAEAQKEIFGENHAFPMIAYGTLKAKSAWKMYAKAKDVDFDLANEVSEQIEKYENALKRAEEDEVDEISVYDYVDEKYHEILKDSESYLGIVSDIKPHPCGSLIYQGNIRRDIGLIKTKSKTGKKEFLCTIMDGKWAEDYKFLKNDLLKVSVVEVIKSVYKRIGIEPHDVNELINISKGNEKVWDIYDRGNTIGINQVEQNGTKHRVMQYKPRNISELCAFVAAIRPGFKSMYKTFANREKFDYGIPTFDKLIQTEEMPNSFMLYQEMAMAALNFAGVPMSECYEVIKNIAKKRAEKVLKYKKIFLEGFANKIQETENKTEEEGKEIADKVWQIISDSVRYSFNASHSYSVAVDSLYGAYLKSHYPLAFYEVFLNILDSKGNQKDRMNGAMTEAKEGFNIKFVPFKFGQDNRKFTLDEKTNTISRTLSSVKGFGESVADILFDIKDNKYNTFVDLLIDIEENTTLGDAKEESLIKLNYFSEYGRNKKLLDIFKEFTEGKNRYDKKHTAKTKEKNYCPI